MTQHHTKTRLRLGLSNRPKQAAERRKPSPAAGGEIQSILFAGFEPGSGPAAGHADDQNDYADTGKHQQERDHGDRDRDGLLRPD